MSFDFLVPIATYPDPTPSAGLVRALDMAASITGKLSVLVEEVDIPPIHNALAETLVGVSAMAAQTEERSRTLGRGLVADIDHIAHRLALPISVRTQRSEPGAFVDAAVAEARLHDATLFLVDTTAEDPSGLGEAILFGSGSPMLVCPGNEGPGHLRAVAIAWDGSRAAARAVKDALPVIRLAQFVTILTASEDKAVGASTVAGISALLAYHGVVARHLDVALNHRPVGEVLQEAALLDGCGLLVMGAYGHSRLREFVLGGATRSALSAPLMPTFMSH